MKSKTRKELMKALDQVEAMQKRIEEMARRTWDSIGGDVLTMLEEQGEPPIMKRLDVVQMVMDYLYQYGQDKEAYKVWKKLPGYDAKEQALLSAFPYETYGW